MGSNIHKYEVVVYSKQDKQGMVRILGEAVFDDYDSAHQYRQHFIANSKSVGSTSIYHPGTTRSGLDERLACMTE